LLQDAPRGSVVIGQRASVSWTAGASAARPRFRTHGKLSHHGYFSSARKRRRRSRSAGAVQNRPPQTAFGRVLADGHHSLRLGDFAPWRLIPSPAQSARGLAHSKTLRAVRWSSASASASWTAGALHRFLIAHETGKQIQTPFALFAATTSPSNSSPGGSTRGRAGAGTPARAGRRSKRP
jgi:hypothetical protein